MTESYREEKDCLVCGSGKKEVIHSWPADYYDHQEYETASWDGRQQIPLQIVKCGECGFMYTSPAFKPEHLGKVYPEDIVPTKVDLNKQMSFGKWNDLLATMKRYLKMDDPICDVGTRYGVLIKLLQKEGFTKAFGLEYNPEAVKRGHQLGIKDVYEGDTFSLSESLAKNNLPQPKAYVMVDVLEHLPYPKKDLEKLAQNIQPGGYLFLKQMDMKSPGAKLFGKSWYYLQPAAHMGFFDKESAREILEQTGFELIEIVRPGVKAQIKEAILQVRKWLQNKKGHKGKVPYTQQRYHLSDMFLVVARKK